VLAGIEQEAKSHQTFSFQGETTVIDKQWGQIVAKAWTDEAFKKRLLADPAAVLKDHGITPRPNVQVRVMENTTNLVHLILPPKTSQELSEEDLKKVAGGTWAQNKVNQLNAGNNNLISIQITLEDMTNYFDGPN
jgi:Nitrile hydratase, alpha chain